MKSSSTCGFVEEKPAMGFIYEAMDQAKEKIQTAFNDIKKSSSGGERNWSAFEMVHTKRRNRLMQKTMNDVVYVRTNSKLGKKKKVRKENDYSIDDLDSDDDWIVENVENSGLDAPNDEDLVELDQVGEDINVDASATASAPLEDELPNFDNDDHVDEDVMNVENSGLDAPNDEDLVELDQVGKDTNVDASATASAPLEDELPNFDNDDHVDEDVMVEDDYYDAGLQSFLD
ncbi:hypothetical protein RIF29_16191 [Crotalaria pallida]|uniref:Uncharacterized protein n=1 Tax=Crotalaria pallida TaxID=3830 RepID=A0AAN9FEU5_CROPI